MNINNVFFDIGNVITRWAPAEIVRLTFGSGEQSEQLASAMFPSDLWLSLNKGQLSEANAKVEMQAQFDLSPELTDRLFYYIKHSQILIFGSLSLLKRVKAAGYKTYALTDNVNEIVDHLKSHYDFWPLFDGAIVSSEVGCLKPEPEIFNHLLNKYSIAAKESVFIDDMSHNVEGAAALGFSAIQFENAIQCEQDLKSLGLLF